MLASENFILQAPSCGALRVGLSERSERMHRPDAVSEKSPTLGGDFYRPEAVILRENPKGVPRPVGDP